MEGQRLKNDFSFSCASLAGKTIEFFVVYFSEYSENDILMIVLKLKEKDLYQRFFLDAGIGFWEEWNEEEALFDLEDCKTIDLGVRLGLLNKDLMRHPQQKTHLLAHINILISLSLRWVSRYKLKELIAKYWPLRQS